MTFLIAAARGRHHAFRRGHRGGDLGRDGAGPDRFFHRHQPAGLFDRLADPLGIQWRLLYNAITRAQRSCFVLVQS